MDVPSKKSPIERYKEYSLKYELAINKLMNKQRDGLNQDPSKFDEVGQFDFNMINKITVRYLIGKVKESNKGGEYWYTINGTTRYTSDGTMIYQLYDGQGLEYFIKDEFETLEIVTLTETKRESLI